MVIVSVDRFSDYNRARELRARLSRGTHKPCSASWNIDLILIGHTLAAFVGSLRRNGVQRQVCLKQT